MIMDYRSYVEGQRAYLSDRGSDSNPYHEGTSQFENWRAGWTDAFAKDALSDVPADDLQTSA